MESCMNTIVTAYPPVTAFELCDPSGVKEPEFEDVVYRVLNQLRPDCTIFPFHPKVYYNDTVWIPDLAVVDKGFTYWFVVEVETATHHLEKHVIPQVAAFCEGRYDGNTVDILSAALGVSMQQAETLFATI